MRNVRLNFLIGTVFTSAAVMLFMPFAVAEDCTGTLPGANCTLDENTTAPLTIDGGIVLTIGGSVLIDHEIDGDDTIGNGDIVTFGGPNTITQNADIGSQTPINSVTIADDNTWNSSAAINTDNSGSDIDLGAADGGETLNFFAGGSFSGEIDGHIGDTVTFGSDGNGGTFSTGGQIETVTVIVGSGELTVSNTVGGGTSLGGVTVADGATLDMDANVTVGGAIDLDGTARIAAGSSLAGDSYVADADASTIILEVARDTGATQSGRLNISVGGPLDLSNDTLQIVMGPQSEVLVNETIASAIIGNTAATIGPNQFVDNSYLYNFNLLANGNDFDLVISVNSLDASATTANNLNVANTVLRNLANVSSPQLNTLQSALGNDSTQEAFNERLEALQPTVDNGYVAASLAVSDQVHKLTGKRVDQLYGQKIISRSKQLLAGSKNLSTGRKRTVNKSKFNNGSGVFWAQGYGSSATQNNKDGLDGFDMSSGGVVFGADTGDMNKDMLLGMAVMAGGASIESKNANATQTDVESYGLAFYGGHKMPNKTLLSGSASYIHSSNKATRYKVGGISGNNASHDNVTEHISLHSKLSHKYKTVKNLTITPSATLGYDYVRANKYAEDGQTDLALIVDPEPVHMMAAGVGVDLDWRHQTLNGLRLNPTAYARYQYDILNKGVESISSFKVAPQQTFVTKGFDPQRSVINLGAGVSAEITEDWDVIAGYDFEYKDKYHSHTGHVSAVRDF